MLQDASVEGSSDANDSALLRKIVQGEFEFHEATWKDISPEAIHFIKTLMCQDPKDRPSCDEALKHPWLNDKSNLEQRAAQRRRRNSGPFLESSSWTAVQQIAFVISVLVILGSYSALISYVFNIAKPHVLFQEFIANIRSEFGQIYDGVNATIDDCLETTSKALWTYMNSIFDLNCFINVE